MKIDLTERTIQTCLGLLHSKLSYCNYDMSSIINRPYYHALKDFEQQLVKWSNAKK